MNATGDKPYPTLLSELFIQYSTGKDLDSDPALSVVCIADWLTEYKNLPADTVDADSVDNLHKSGCELNAYIPTVVARIHGALALHKVNFISWSATTKTQYTGEKLSDAARERRLQTEEQYTLYHKDFAILETIEKWCVEMAFAIRECLKDLQMREEKIVSDRPLVQRQ